MGCLHRQNDCEIKQGWKVCGPAVEALLSWQSRPYSRKYLYRYSYVAYVPVRVCTYEDYRRVPPEIYRRSAVLLLVLSATRRNP